MKTKGTFYRREFLIFACFVGSGLLLTQPCYASLESSLIGIKSKLTGVILPVLSVIGLGLAAISFVTGNPNARQHITYAILGAIFGFGAQAIVDFIAQIVH